MEIEEKVGGQRALFRSTRLHRAGVADSQGERRQRGFAHPLVTGYRLETERTTVAPTAPPDGQEGPAEGTVWQGTVAIPVPRTSSIITVQLVTPAVELADDYRGVLLGVARTVTFEDPAAPDPAEGNNVFGPFSDAGSGAEEGSPFG